MTYHQLFSLLDETGLSLNDFAQLMGISGMTLHRWSKQSMKKKVQPVYIPAIREACYILISEGKLSASSDLVQGILVGAHSAQRAAVLKNFGLEEEQVQKGGWNDFVMLNLSQVGAQVSKQAEVDQNQKKIFSFKNLGAEWSERISGLWNVLRSDQLTLSDKLIAYGALFYLLTPLDFIPDSIPVFGLLDDYCVLGIAASYYAARLATAAANNQKTKLKPV